LLKFWFRRELNDNQGISEDLKPIFSLLCNAQVEQYRHARVILASRLIALFRVDHVWTEEFLLPLFNWQSSDTEARAAWEGFLWSPRLYRPLLIAFKSSLLETAHHYDRLGKHGRQYATFLTYAALESDAIFTSAELYEAISALPQAGLQQSVNALVQALEGAGEQREQYWANRIQPFWQKVWPKSRQLASQDLAEQLAKLAIAAREEFPSALSMVRDWLRPSAESYYVVHLLQRSNLCAKFPRDALMLLDAIIDVDNLPWIPVRLGEVLMSIAQACPELKDEHKYQRLIEYSRRN
jgi:hypothetical protein